MALTKEDLHAIERIVERIVERIADQKLEPIRVDLKEIKSDVKFLAALNQLDEIKKDPRLRRLYENA
jgi:hypothetical protein